MPAHESTCDCGSKRSGARIVASNVPECVDCGEPIGVTGQYRSAFVDGWRARDEGKPIQACPYGGVKAFYRYGSPNYVKTIVNAWRTGWETRDAQKEV